MFALNPNNSRNPVQLIGINAPFQPKIQFGRAYLPDVEPRSQSSAVNHRLGAARHPTRVSSNGHSIHQPAPVREQTVWRSHLSPELQRQLSLGFNRPLNQGRNQPRELPQLDSIAAPNHELRQSLRASHVTSVPHTSGQWVLRATLHG